jgi:hypothetical protein
MNMKRIVIVCFTLVTLCVKSQTLNNVEYHGRYIDVDNKAFYSNTFYVDFHMHENLFSYFGGVSLIHLQEMAALWHQTGTYFRFNFIADAGEYPILNFENYPQRNVIGADVQKEVYNFTFDPNKKKFSGLAMTRNWYRESTYDCNNWYEPWFFGADIIFNTGAPIKIFNNYECNMGIKETKYDFNSILLHELGHAMGIGHHPTAKKGIDVMYEEQIPGNCLKRLSLTDAYAAKRLYGEDLEQITSIPCSSFVKRRDLHDRGLPYKEEKEIICCSWCSDNVELKNENYNKDTKVKRAKGYIKIDGGKIKNKSDITYISSDYVEITGNFETDDSKLEIHLTGIECNRQPVWCTSKDGTEASAKCLGGGSDLMIANPPNPELLASRFFEAIEDEEDIEYLQEYYPEVLSTVVSSSLQQTGIHPNPNTGVFTVQFGSVISDATITIYNSIGKKVYQTTLAGASKSDINLTHLAPGVYYVSIFDGEAVKVEKVIYQKFN